MNPNTIALNLRAVQERIAQAAKRSGRDGREVLMVGVVKKRPAAAIQALLELGVFDLGENYPQELWKKTADIGDRRARWHLIGHLQSNKAHRTYPLTRMIHSVDSTKLLGVLDALATKTDRPATVCLQVNVSREPNKHGWAPEAILEDADHIAETRNVPIVGLMTMAALGSDSDQARRAFAELRDLRDRLRSRTGLELPHLSMGMSADYEVAVEEGATIVRIGSALFEGGER